MRSVPSQWVTLRVRAPTSAHAPTLRADLDAEGVEAMLRQAERLGLPPSDDPSARALLAAVRLRDDVPPLLYAALAAVLSRVLAAADVCAGDAATRRR
ncbi:MAG TPA: flagellar biosynthesis protein [Rhodanobacteraceae bacterium]|nr:flagellar biosynthesis protein [Rhodanobacteraceae bacterium]